MSKHTPGPWKVKGGMYRHQFDVMKGMSALLAEGLNEADAHLIAAAPELYDFAVWAVNQFIGDSGTGISYWLDFPAFKKGLDAIIKAEGGEGGTSEVEDASEPTNEGMEMLERLGKSNAATDMYAAMKKFVDEYEGTYCSSMRWVEMFSEILAKAEGKGGEGCLVEAIHKFGECWIKGYSRHNPYHYKQAESLYNSKAAGKGGEA